MSVPDLLPEGLGFRRLLSSSDTEWTLLAHDPESGDDVVVHTALVPPAAREAVPGMDHQARRLAALRHPGLELVHRLLRSGPRVQIVSEYLDAPSLRADLARALPSAVQRIALLRQIADALATAHRCGVVHGSLGPDTVRVHARRGAVLVDLGLHRLRPTIPAQRGTAPAPEGVDADLMAFGELVWWTMLRRTSADVPAADDPHPAAWPELPDEVTLGLWRAVDPDPRVRPTAAELVDLVASVRPAVWGGPVSGQSAGRRSRRTS
ncbi:hypothetical protein GIS00_14990 [Nakamurella sp. YIM 132087]|uniref:Protein kinase domain-containing protein n=1 Tax=Nakamurella alba TaxID=2665158 RepID=A0A7K1FMB3_9ACTN|nr:hypothetical protein [Nakamurella alba]MTD15246.1 hypothetical protein [Nakamurella alba]